jgi:acetyl esterase/lipase
MKRLSKLIHQPQCRPASGASFRNKLAVAFVAFVLTGCGPSIALSAHPHPWPTPQYEDVPYTGKADSKYQKLDIYLPQGKSDHPTPIVLFIHGGGWYEGDKRHPHVLQLLDKGIAVASMNYRLTDEAPWPAQIYDVKAAIRYLRANAAKYNIDPDQIGAWGMSAGGHLAALAGTAGDVTDLEGTEGPQGVSSRVQAVVDWFGPTDFTPFATGAETLGKNVDFMVDRFLGGKITEHRAEAKAASPVTYVTPDDPPFLIMHGTTDALVPLWQSQRFAEAIEKAGGKATLVVIEGQGHQLFPQQYFDQVMQFFQTNLQPKTEPSSPQATPLQTP